MEFPRWLLLEEGETLLQAAIRETQEETGVLVAPQDFSLVHVLHVQANSSNTRTIIGIYFMAERWAGTPTNNDPKRHSDASWFDIENLPTNTTEHAHQAIDGLASKIYYSEN